MALKSLVAVLIGGCALLVTAPVSADETGLAGIHSFSRESGRTCFADHWHTWSGGVQKTKPAALAAAVKGWTSFTDMEYGSDWAHFSRAAAKKISCSKSSDGFGCTVEARPCK